MPVIFDTYCYTNKGPRPENQDSLDTINLGNTFAACIADGVGGADCGKIASNECTSFFINNVYSYKSNLQRLISLAHQNLKELQNVNKSCREMASTFTGCIIKGNLLNGVHVGDSRLCILRRNGIKQLSEDHTEVQRLYKSGKLASEDIKNYPRKNVLESAIGANKPPIIQSFKFKIEKGDRILMTTDGIHDIISKLEFRNLSIEAQYLKGFGDSIVKLLKEKKIKDNASFIVLSH